MKLTAYPETRTVSCGYFSGCAIASRSVSRFSTFTLTWKPPIEKYAQRSARFGAHNIHENYPLETSFQSDTLIFGAFFSMGVRAYDVSNPFHPEEVGYYVPLAPPGGRLDAIQMNDVYVDENRLIYAIDRIAGGLYILELTA